MTMYSRVIGTGSYLPKKVVTNHDLEKIVETSHDWIVERSGIHQRHVIDEGESTSTMALAASHQALKNAGVKPDEIDLIIVATITPDRVIPSVACMLQADLKAPVIAAFDLSAACAGFIYALSTADQFIKSGAAKNVLVVGAEAMSVILDWKDRRTCVLFGDGAGAVVLRADQKPGIHSSCLHADGRSKDVLYVGSGLPGYQSEALLPYVYMEGKEVFKFAVNTLGDLVTEALETKGWTADQIDWLVPHQANNRIIQAFAKKLDLPSEQVIVTIKEHGNTSAASIPLAFHQGVMDGRIKEGDNILMVAIGGGFAWGSVLMTL